MLSRTRIQFFSQIKFELNIILGESFHILDLSEARGDANSIH